MTQGSKVRRALAWSTVNNLVVRLGNFGVGILLARLLAPSEFGIFAVALTVQTIVVTFAELGMSSDLIRNGDIDRRAGTVTTVAAINGGLLALSMSLLATPIASLLGSAQAAPTVRVMSLTLVLAGLSVVPYAKLQREFRQSTQLGLDAISLVLGTLATVGLYALGFGAMALAISRVFAQLTVCVMQYVVTRTRPQLGFDRSVAISLVRFGLPLASANLLSWVVMNVDYMVVGGMAGALTLGYYMLAFNISSWPMTALGQAIRSVALPGFAQLGDSRRQAASFGSAVALSWAAALLVGVLLSSLAKTVVPLVYGAKWMLATQALAGLAFFGALRVVFDLAATFLIAVGATRPVLLVQVIWVIVLGPAMAVGVQTNGLSGAGWAHVVVSVLVVLPVYVVLLRRHQVGLWLLVRHLMVPTLCAVPAVATGLFVARHIDSLVLALFAGGAAATVVYLAPLVRWLPRRLRELNRSGAPEDSPPVEDNVAAYSAV
jgi:PST family polysaccharide transporter